MILLQPTEAGVLLGISWERVRQLADRFELRIAARTRRGGRLFHPADVERLRRKRERAKNGKNGK